jgi:hypothetical protein
VTTLLWWLGCATAEIHEPCVDDPDLCPSCEAPEDCAWQGNSCLDFVDCASVDANLSYVMIGCEYEHRWPAADQCTCIHGTCRFAE